MKKKNITIGIITAIAAFIVQLVIFYNKSGIHFFSEEPYLKYMVPIWSLMISFGGYEIARIYNQQKEDIFSSDQPQEEKRIFWLKKRYWMISNALFFLSKILLVTVPVYIIAYFDDYKYINSSIAKIVILITSVIIIYVIGRVIRKKSDRF